MERRYSLGAGRGWLSVREEGAKAVCRAELADDGRGLYKAYLTGRGGRLPLGALTPEGGCLALRRTLDVEELCRRGFWPPVGGGVELAFSFQKKAVKPPPPGWVREEQPGRLMGDDVLSRSAAQARGVLLRREGEGFQLALPYDPAREFAMTPLFCFAHPVQLEGRSYVIFFFNRCGCPIFPHKEGCGGETNGVNHTKE